MKLNYPSLRPRKSKPPRTGRETERYLKRKWGKNFEQNLKKAQQLLKEFGTEEFIEYLEHSSLGDFGPLIERIYEVAEKQEAALHNTNKDQLQYDDMARAEVNSNSVETRDELNRAFSDAYDDYVVQHGNIDTAFPQHDLFVVP